MKYPLAYTYDGLERELNLLEIHLKESPKGDEAFCKDCIDKHISTARGFALEGPGFTKDKEEQKRFLEAEKKLGEIKGKNYKEDGVELAQKVRVVRKNLSEGCPECEEELGSEKVKIIKKITKGLNNEVPYNDYNLNLEKNKMADYKALAFMNAGQFAAEGVRYVAQTYPTLEPGKWDQYITIGGGIALQIIPLFIGKIPKMAKDIAMVTGSNLLAGGVVKLVKGMAETPIVGVAAARNVAVANTGVGGYAGKAASYAPVSGGPTFAGKVTAKNIPSQYARAGILAGAQAFERPEHADLIRVD